MGLIFTLTGACIFVALVIYGVVQLSKNVSVKKGEDE